MAMTFAEGISVAMLYCWVNRIVLVQPLLLQKFGYSIDVDKINNGEYILGFSTRNTFAIGEEPAALIVDVFSELIGVFFTFAKGEKF